MDGTQFDMIIRRLGQLATRRWLIGGSLGMPAAIVHLLQEPTDAHKKHRHKRKKVTLCADGQTIKVGKKRKDAYLADGATVGACPSLPPPPPVVCRDMFGSYTDRFQCGDKCCREDWICCIPDGTSPEWANCYGPGHYCCPGGPACRLDQICCGFPYWIGSTCATPSKGEFCCGEGTQGGSCKPGQKCCPIDVVTSALCCPVTSSCCDVTADCNEGAGETCVDGCCVIGDN